MRSVLVPLEVLHVDSERKKLISGSKCQGSVNKMQHSVTFLRVLAVQMLSAWPSLSTWGATWNWFMLALGVRMLAPKRLSDNMVCNHWYWKLEIK